jgi:hypothetical protein
MDQGEAFARAYSRNFLAPIVGLLAGEPLCIVQLPLRLLHLSLQEEIAGLVATLHLTAFTRQVSPDGSFRTARPFSIYEREQGQKVDIPTILSNIVDMPPQIQPDVYNTFWNRLDRIIFEQYQGRVIVEPYDSQ